MRLAPVHLPLALLFAGCVGHEPSNVDQESTPGAEDDAGVNEPDLVPDAGHVLPTCADATWADWEPQGHLVDYEELGPWSSDALNLALEYWGAEALASEQMPTSTVYRIRYTTQAPKGRLREATGLATIPRIEKPAPIVAWSHGTTGVADACAPSLIEFMGVEGVAASQTIGWMVKGYASVLPDYAGLGSEGLHPYGVSEAEGASVLDSIRALQELDEVTGGGRVSNIAFLAGHSQGGHATLAAHEMVGSYAPEVDYRGAIPESPGSELPTLLLQYMRTQSAIGVAFGALLIYAWSDYYGLDLRSYVLDPWATDIARWASEECLEEFAQHFEGDIEIEQMVTPGALEDPELRELLVRNSPRGCADAPIRLQVGSEDQFIPSAATDVLFDHLCESGNQVERVIYEGDHGVSGRGSAAVDAVAWTEAILSGEPSGDDCR